MVNTHEDSLDLDRFIRANRQKALGFARKLTQNDRDTAEDYVAEATFYLMRFCGKHENSIGKGKEYQFFCRTIIRIHLDRAKRAKILTMVSIENDFGNWEHKTRVLPNELPEDLGTVNEILGCIPNKDMRQTIKLFAVDDLSYEEVAVALGISPITVKTRMHRIRCHFRESGILARYFEQYV